MYSIGGYIKFYKSFLLPSIHSELNKKGTFSIDEVDQLLKSHCGVEKSCKDMEWKEINELIVWCFDFGDSIGIHLNFPNNEFNINEI